MALEQHIKHVPGDKATDVFVYALSTCGWCRRTLSLLNELGVEYDYIHIDLLDGEAKQEALDRVRIVNPGTSFPTMVINGQPIIGFKEDEMREALRSGRG